MAVARERLTAVKTGRVIGAGRSGGAKLAPTIVAVAAALVRQPLAA